MWLVKVNVKLAILQMFALSVLILIIEFLFLEVLADAILIQFFFLMVPALQIQKLYSVVQINITFLQETVKLQLV